MIYRIEGVSTVSLATLVTGAMGGLISLRILIEKKNDKYLLLFSSLFLLYIVLVSFDLLLYPSFIVDYLSFIYFFLVIIVTPLILADLGREYIITILFYLALVVLFIHSLSFFIGYRDYIGIYGNFIGLFPSRHQSAKILEILYPIFLLNIIHRKKKWIYIPLAVSVLFLIMTLQRTTILSFFIFIILFLIVFFKQNISRKYLISLIVTSAIILIKFLFVYPLFLDSRVTAEFEGFLSGQYNIIGQGRMGIIISALKDYFHSYSLVQKLFGNGLSSSYYYHNIIVGYRANAHVDLIRFLIDLGLVGLLVFSFFIYKIFMILKYQLKIKENVYSKFGMIVLAVFVCELFYSVPINDGGTNFVKALLLFIGAKTWKNKYEEH